MSNYRASRRRPRRMQKTARSITKRRRMGSRCTEMIAAASHQGDARRRDQGRTGVGVHGTPKVPDSLDQ